VRQKHYSGASRTEMRHDSAIHALLMGVTSRVFVFHYHHAPKQGVRLHPRIAALPGRLQCPRSEIVPCVMNWHSTCIIVFNG